MGSRRDSPLINPYFDLFQAVRAEPDEFQLVLRKKLIWAFAWAVPDEPAIRAIASFGAIAEWGAGTGYWAFLLAQAGAKVRAFDQEPDQPPRWSAVERSDLKLLASLEGHSLFLCWPPLGSAMAREALAAYAGERVIYVGEADGRTAEASFHRDLKKHWRLSAVLQIPNWPGFHDQVHFFERPSC